MQAKPRPSAALLFALLSQLMGCGQAEYPLAPVAGEVTLDGEPLMGATIVFQPRFAGVTGKTAPGSVGRTNKLGRYELMTVNDERGAAIGQHRVRIYSHSPESAPVSDTDSVEKNERIPDRYN